MSSYFVLYIHVYTFQPPHLRTNSCRCRRKRPLVSGLRSLGAQNLQTDLLSDLRLRAWGILARRALVVRQGDTGNALLGINSMALDKLSFEGFSPTACVRANDVDGHNYKDDNLVKKRITTATQKPKPSDVGFRVQGGPLPKERNRSNSSSQSKTPSSSEPIRASRWTKRCRRPKE